MTEPQPHPEQEYIVLEHELSNIERYPYDPVTRQVTFKAIRSRLHSHGDNTSDKVLDDLLKEFQKRNEQGNFRPWNIGHITDMINEFKEELHQKCGRP